MIPGPFQFKKRIRRPPTDPVNSLLSLGYTFLLSKIVAESLSRSLEIELGMLHEIRPKRPSLACDLIEPLRVPVVDRWVLRMLNRQSVAISDFRFLKSGKVLLTKKAFPRVMNSFNKQLAKKQAEITNVIDDFVERLRGGG